jgi:hypothetical protein
VIAGIVQSGRPNHPRLHYPFIDDATLVAGDGLELPEDVFRDAALYAPGGLAGQYLSGVLATAQDITFVVSDAGGELCRGTVGRELVDQIPLEDQYGRGCGVLVPGDRFASFVAQVPTGEHSFGLGAAEFTATCVTPMPSSGISGFLLDDGSFVSGDVWIVGRDGVTVRLDEDNVVRVHATGDPQFRIKNCGDAVETELPIPLQKLDVTLVDSGQATVRLTPDIYGGVHIYPGRNQANKNVLRVEPLENGIRLRVLTNVRFEIGAQSVKQ